ncbi:unnamed protein product [Paramecium primaurelia]|uniref:Uncharacterized protein n=1 Tax=Paramecium primaurelia TaxID=5886 RepID=A0A8S1N0S8_PARPR|nr:unnamed protein product [Paramecium primaurelia]
MGNTCQFSKIDKQHQRIRLIGVECQQFPNKQTKLENYSYNIQDNIDNFEEEFYNKDFEFDIHNEKVYEHEQINKNVEDDKPILLNSLVILEEKQTKTQFGSYNQMASEAFVNCIKQRLSIGNQKFDRFRENVQQQKHLNSIQHLSHTYGRTQFKVTDNDSITQNSSRICKSTRGSKSTFQSSFSLNQKSNIKQISSKQVCNIKIVYL